MLLQAQRRDSRPAGTSADKIILSLYMDSYRG